MTWVWGGPFRGTKKPILVSKKERKQTHCTSYPTTLLLALQPSSVPIYCLLFLSRLSTRNGKPASASALVAVEVAAAWPPRVSGAHKRETHPALRGRPTLYWHSCGGVRAAVAVGVPRYCQRAWGLSAARREGGGHGGGGCAEAVSGRRRCNARMEGVVGALATVRCYVLSTLVLIFR